TGPDARSAVASAGSGRPEASADGAARGGADAARRSYEALIRSLLDRAKRYPPRARARRREGVGELAFEIGPDGAILRPRLTASTGHAALDAEILALAARASPLPQPPAELAGRRLGFTAAIAFRLR
ncbi:MAG: TonB family protein, partial [Pseudomonadota bacterium]